MFEAVCQDPERQRLCFRNGFVPSRPVRENSRQLGHFPEPSAIVFALDLNTELIHMTILTCRPHFTVNIARASSGSLA
jgi:hypothetical protein